MIVTKKYIQKLREKSFINISNEAEKEILSKFGNTVPIQYTEQDVWEQIRKILKSQI
jgi:NADPH:quinone reductase-like Zn-dependent oxidoreductase